MSRMLSCKETAKLIRKQLKITFPGQKFSVRSETYAGGASIQINWIDGPTDDQVKKISSGFSGKDFDGMIDMAYYTTSWLMPDGSAIFASNDGGTGDSRGSVPAYENDKPHPDAEKIHFGADYVFTHRNSSADVLALCALSVHKEKSRFSNVTLPSPDDYVIEGSEWGAYIRMEKRLWQPVVPGSRETFTDLANRRFYETTFYGEWETIRN